MPPGSRISDPIRDMVFAAVQHHLLPPGQAPALIELPYEVESVDAIAVTPYSTRITVSLLNGKTRRFWVKVTEEW